MKKYLRLMLAAAVVLVLACSAGAEYYDEGHSGTAGDPYVIDTNADLVMLRDRVNAGTESGDMYYKLTQNLTISQYTDWETIGTDNHPFTGHFDGNNLAIQVNITDRPYWGERNGLFGTVSTTEGYAIKNLTVSGTVKGKNVGGIVWKLNSSSIENCSFTGNAETNGNYEVDIGGIVTYLAGGLVKNCTVSGNVSRPSTNTYYVLHLGGIAAYMTGGSIENCTVSGNVQAGGGGDRGGDRSCVGGIVGYAQVAGFEAIKDCTFSGNVGSRRYAGGIAGYVSGGNLQNNSITGNANGQASITGGYASGGIAGRIGDSTVLESCDVSSIVIVSGDTTAEGIGGIVGIMNASTVRNNQSYASIEGDIPNMGGVVGKLDAASYTISNNRYSSAEHGIGNNAQGVPSEEGCIKVGASIAITTASPLTQAYVNNSYSVTLASDAASSVVWSLTNSTTLPAGLTLDRTTGTISGTPTKADTYTFTVKASPASGAPATKEFTLVVSETAPDPTTITITTASLPSGTVGSSYSATLEASLSNATWSISSGSLPNGLRLSSSGVISGTPTSSGSATFTVRAESGNASATKSLSITINPAGTTTITITTTSLPSGTVNSSYNATLASTPSGASWSISSGSLPSGLSLSSSGVISGTPTRAGTSRFTVMAVYGSASAAQELSITISSSSNGNDDPGESSGGGGCDSGFAGLGLMILAGFALKKSHR